MKIIGKIPLWMLLCLFGLSQTTETACSSALPDIADKFNLDGGIVQFSSSIYFLGFALGILSLGRVSDIFGRRLVVIYGMVLYIISSIASIFANNIEILILLRFCQAFGASVGSVIGQAMARDSYHGRELSYIYASLSIGLALMPSIGSAIGGYIVQYSGWRYIFVFLSCTASLLLLIYIKYLPETNPYIGIARNNRYFTIFKIVMKDKIVLLYAFIIGSFNGMAFGFYIEAPFIFIQKIGMLPSEYGRLAFLLSAANVFGSFTSRYLVVRHVNTKKLMISGLILSFVGCFSMFLAPYIFFNNNNKILAVAVIFIPMMLHLVGHSLLIPMTLRYALEDYSKVTGAAGSIFGSLYYILVALISFTVSKLHGDTITKFTLLFLFLSIASSFSFYLIQKWHPLRKVYEFN